MPTYAFEGRREATGELVKGTRDAASHGELGQELLTEGILLTRYEEKKKRAAQLGRTLLTLGGVPLLEKTLFARYFALMLRAGLDIKRAIAALGEQAKSRVLQTVLGDMYHDLETGKRLADSMASFPQVFSPIFVSMIRIGESTGRLEESLRLLAEQLQKEYELKRAVRGALLYPSVIVVAMIAVGVAMMVFVIPRLAEVFEGFDVQLPLPTRVLIGLSVFITQFWYLVILLVVAAGIGFWLLVRIRRTREAMQHGLLYLPVVGSIIQQVNLARFTRNLSSLLRSGVPFVESLSILAESTPHPSYAATFGAAAEHVKQGKPLSEFLSQKRYERLFPSVVVNVVRVGEETGALDSVLFEIAQFYEGEVDQLMKNLASVIEPVLVVVIGVAVGALAISVISPIYELVNVI